MTNPASDTTTVTTTVTPDVAAVVAPTVAPEPAAPAAEAEHVITVESSPDPNAAPEPEVVAPAAEVAVPGSTEVVDPAAEEKWTHQSEWKHAWLPFKGDELAIRVPKGAALQALGAARHNSLEFQDRLVNLFVAKHLSPETYERVMYRMVDPDDEEFTTGAWGELIGAIAEIGGEHAKAEAEALAEVANGKAGKGK
ncbi:hypothetical protein [Mycobacterium sp. DL440]|uniref:hypothetical protein n=1 Tax=Mycobacterium sp. DL440 TaxID=2675523 RepID=UPI0014231D35|nr:hypothetical protein [Mycobacterium sp. DL440]